METLYELDLAQNETSVYVEDVLGMEHTDAPNSYLRDVDGRSSYLGYWKMHQTCFGWRRRH